MSKVEELMETHAALEIINALENGYTGRFIDLKDQLFQDDFVSSKYKAELIIKGYGWHNAVEVLYRNNVEKLAVVDLADFVPFVNLLYRTVAKEFFDSINGLIESIECEEVYCNRRKNKMIINLIKSII